MISDKKQRVDIFLSALFPDFSRSYIQKMIDKSQVQVNSKIVNKNIKIDNKDEISLEVKLESFFVKAEEISLAIVYEDENILIINKEAGINTHPTPWENWKSWTLVNAILHHCKNKLPNIWWVERPWIVHRLDKNTSWLIMIAKTDFMMIYLQNIIKDREVWKYYLAIVNWIIPEKIFRIESYIWRDSADRTKMTTINPINQKFALTLWEVVSYIDNKFTLVKLKLETGRTHQIRVHLSSIWFPIIWDEVYWNAKVNREVEAKYWLKRQALHSYELELELYGEKKSFKWELKEDMKKIIWTNKITKD